MSLLLNNPVQPVLDMPPDSTTWRRCQSILDPAARWRVYLHQLGLSAILKWFTTEFDTCPQPWPEIAPFDIWHVVNGLAITLRHRRIVVILSEAIDAAELEVPQEWVDIPEWAAHYYIAAQIDVDEQQLVLWGYTTHAQLKANGIFDTDERLYCLSDIDLVQDFAVFQAVQTLAQAGEKVDEQIDEQLAFSLAEAQNQAISAANKTINQSSVKDTQTDQLLQRLAQQPDPRLEIPFDQWQALLSDVNWRQQLYQQRQGRSPVNLWHWLEQRFDQSWKALETLRPQDPALRFRAAPPVTFPATSSAAPSTAKPVVRSKLICLRTVSAYSDLVLVLSLSIEADSRRKIRVQLYPFETKLLPDSVKLILERPETGAQLQAVQASAQDNYIQLPIFRCSAERLFRVRVQLSDRDVYEDFIS